MRPPQTCHGTREEGTGSEQGIGCHCLRPNSQSSPMLPEDDRKQLRHKLEVAYFVATEKVSFKKDPKLCELEARHGVDVGTTYVIEVAG